MALFSDVASFSLGILLIAAGVLKRSSRVDMSAVFQALAPATPEPLRSIFAKSLPWIEILAGLAALSPHRPSTVGLALCALFASFFFVSAWIFVTRADVSCRCFGDYFRAGRGVALVRSALLLGLAASAASTAPAAAPSDRIPELALAYFLTAIVSLQACLAYHAWTLHRSRAEERVG